MAMFSIHHPWVFIFGLLGNFVSFMVYLAPVPTFFKVCKKKSTEGFQSVPYVVALFSAMLWIYYAYLKSNAYLLITINSLGCIIETIYISVYIAYAPKQARVLTLKLLLLLNFGGFFLIIVLSHFLVKGSIRVRVLGWVCVALSVSVFAAPLSIMRLVIRTKSVEFMPFSLSFFLALSAIMWLFYGILLKDLYIALPNVLGFAFGVLQMVLYVIYKNGKKVICEQKLPEHNIAKISTTTTSEAAYLHEFSQPKSEENTCKLGKDHNMHDQTDHNEKTMEAPNQSQPNECAV